MEIGYVFGMERGEPKAEIVVHDYAFVKRVLSSGDIGFAEGYMAGEWSTPDLTAVLEFFSHNWEASGKLTQGGLFLKLINSVRNRLFRQNTRSGSKKNILAHYDLGNEFYEKWLDSSMTYSSGIFHEDSTPMELAQSEKYTQIAKSIGASPDTHILEIGSGWGGFAEVAAKEFGSRVTTITISDAQHAYASKRIFDQGLSERVSVELRDYRDVTGRYDGVASIEMFEAVGEEYWPSYFRKVADVLEHGKRAAFQIITIQDPLFESYRKRVDFIQKYVFPGGMLPSTRALNEQFAKAGLKLEKANMFGQSYAETLKRWQKSFNDAWPEIEPLGFDVTFQRLWNFYLSYCEAGFRSGRIDVGQFSLQRAH